MGRSEKGNTFALMSVLHLRSKATCPAVVPFCAARFVAQ